MKRNIYCPLCAAKGYKPQILGKCEDISGHGTLYMWCKKCREEIPIRVDSLKL